MKKTWFLHVKSDSSRPDWVWCLKNALCSVWLAPLTGIMGDSSSHHERIVILQLQTKCCYVMGLDNQDISIYSIRVIVKYAKNNFPWLQVWQKHHDRFNIVVRGHNTEVNQLAWCCDDLTQTSVQFCQAYNQILNCSLYLVWMIELKRPRFPDICISIWSSRGPKTVYNMKTKAICSDRAVNRQTQLQRRQECSVSPKCMWVMKAAVNLCHTTLV